MPCLQFTKQSFQEGEILELDYDDVLLTPQLSELDKREDVDLTTKVTDNYELKIPLIASPMNTVVDTYVARILHLCGGLAVLHRYQSIEKQVNEVKELLNYNVEPIAAAISISEPKRTKSLIDAGANILFLDIAHGHLKKANEYCKSIKRDYDYVDLVTGNIVTLKAANDLGLYVDAYRVGIGKGLACITTQITGVGMPILSAIQKIYFYNDYNLPIISDGGIRYTSDIVKSLAFGANAVMIGHLFAECKDSPLFRNTSKVFAKYYGMGSKEALDYRSKHDPSYDKYKSIHYIAPEGKCVQLSRSNELLEDRIIRIVNELKIALSYMGAHNINDLQTKCQYVVRR